jgi:DNA-binding protein Alba
MEKYTKVSERITPEEKIKENEIRITSSGKMKNYIDYAEKNLTNAEKPNTEVILKAMGRAINKAVTIAEILKRRVPGLHQITRVHSTEVTDVWEPIEEGLDRIETTRRISSISIILSTKPLDTSDPGYQPPISQEQQPMRNNRFIRRRGRGNRVGGRRGRGGSRGRGGLRRIRGGNFRRENNFENIREDNRGFRGGSSGRRGYFRGRGGLRRGLRRANNFRRGSSYRDDFMQGGEETSGTLSCV